MADREFAQLLAEVGRTIGIPDLAANDDHVCHLLFDGRHQVHIISIPARDCVLLSCAVGATALTPEQALDAVRSNFLQVAEGIVACAAPQDGRLLLQCSRSRRGASAADILSAIETLLHQVEAWEVKQSRACLIAAKPQPANKFLMRSV